MSEDLLCTKHRLPVTFVCTIDACNSRRMCEECKTKENLHFTQHGNYIYRLKDFYDYSASQELIPRLEKGIQDSENFISSHKSFYRQQSRLLRADFEVLNEQFKEVTEGYRNIYLQAFQKEMNMFDEDIMSIKRLLNEYLYEKSQQQSFFSRLFSSDDKAVKQPLDELVKKHSKVFRVRAGIISLRTRIATAKANKTNYKSTPQDQTKFNQLRQYLRSFLVGFYDKFKDLLNNQGSSTNLKASIFSESRSLATSQVSLGVQPNQLSTSQVSIASMNSLSSSRSIQSARLPEKVKSLPEAHPNVLKVLKHLRPIEYPSSMQAIPGFTKRDEGPFKYSLGTYYGTYQQGVRSGKGTFIFSKDSSYYEGTWQDDNMWGYGRLITPNSYYEGQISNGMAHGYGTFENSFLVYSGEWRCDKRHGTGEQTYKQTRSNYKGQFVNDKYHGRGTLEESDFIFTGEFKDGLYDGEGVLKYRNGETFTGKFKAGQKLQGKHVMPDGSYYEGQYEGGVPHGRGEFRWLDGVRYLGSWKNGFQDGEGVQKVQGGREIKGLWRGGSWVKWL